MNMEKRWFFVVVVVIKPVNLHLMLRHCLPNDLFDSFVNFMDWWTIVAVFHFESDG